MELIYRYKKNWMCVKSSPYVPAPWWALSYSPELPLSCRLQTGRRRYGSTVHSWLSGAGADPLKQSKLRDVLSILFVRPQWLLGAPSREGGAMQVPAQSVGAICEHADGVKPPSGRAAQGGEGLADPAVLGRLEVAGQDSSLVLQLLDTDDTPGCETGSDERFIFVGICAAIV